MTEERLIQNIIDQVIEAQLKLGYREESMRLYFPLSSLNAILKTDYSEGEMLSHLQDRESYSCNDAVLDEVIRQLHFSVRKERFEIGITSEGITFIHENVKPSNFLKDLINLFETKHHCSEKEIRDIFAKYEKDYIFQKMTGEDFDWVCHFRDASIDAYYYCFKDEMGHIIYHRFIQEDYEALLG